jgi:hypothetical protein
MLDERVGPYVRCAVRTRARELAQDLNFRLLQVDTEARRAGHLGGSGHLRGYSVELLRELRNRARNLFLEIQRALVLYPQALDSELKSHLISLYSTETRAECSQLQKWVDQKFGTAAATHWRIHAGALSRQLTEECDHLRDRYILEIVALVQTLVQSYQPRQSSGALETTRG